MFSEGSSLKDVAKNINSEKYANELGPFYEVQKDLKLLSEAMLNKAGESEFFPRGRPRIILFVDDLDRCTEEAVVRGLEVLELLVKEKLFVAVIAIDPRYVCLSLEKHHKEVLHKSTAPTGMDYIEKIIQLPFRLPGMSEKHVGQYVRHQVEIDNSVAEPIQVNSADMSDNPPATTPQNQDSPSNRPADKQSNATEIVDNHEALPSNKVKFTEEEVQLLEKTIKLFPLPPRTVKRIINAFKIITLVWKRSGTSEVDDCLKKATLFLMLMASDENTRQATHQIFAWMESGMVTYHRVRSESRKIRGKAQGKNNLADLFITRLSKRKSLQLLPLENDQASDNETLDQASDDETLVFHIETYLNYGWDNIKGWQDICAKFVWARSFSFYRLQCDSADDEGVCVQSK